MSLIIYIISLMEKIATSSWEQLYNFENVIESAPLIVFQMCILNKTSQNLNDIDNLTKLYWML